METETFLRFLNGNWSSTPLLVVIVVCIVEHFHHTDISLLVNRIKSLDVLGNKMDLGTTVTQNDTFGDINLGDGLLEIQNVKSNENENKGITDRKKKMDESNIDQIKKYYEFEMIYNSAFGTQLQMLDQIKRNGNQPMPYQMALNYYMSHQNLLPPVNRSADSSAYFKFMEETKTIKRENDCFQLTEFGKEFLTYIYARNYNLALKML